MSMYRLSITIYCTRVFRGMGKCKVNGSPFAVSRKKWLLNLPEGKSVGGFNFKEVKKQKQKWPVVKRVWLPKLKGWDTV